MPDHDEREAQILHAATDVILRQGYDKTTMNDIAEEAGVSRGTVYLYFKGKEELFEALLYWEWRQYSQVWLEALESDPRGGTIGGFYRALFRAVGSRPLMASIMRRDRRVLGNYLRKPDNLVARIESGLTTLDLIKALQALGAVRQDLDPEVTAHLLETLSYGQLTIADFHSPDQFPPFPVVMEALASMLDRWLLPEDGGNSEAGKQVFRQMAVATKEQLEQMRRARGQAEDVKE
ncbi:TetR/AcrR family transcriptional regulator [Ktedonosporobacter rubrisoli]|uniref:TetR/AcrR family transcriptional regulator n=1 Tax=Ktedonosporobacter rubrisoli TaxID=2509675 RepID=A0A4P6JPC4_KTERU|nr:TetR/AcrR family transcriptional regulator [Ktedonosporobacter rubrisoli]QBD77094.1 TetR/AcrR family transcriptional regulator [Ktedonosporobacter rubrisoli]